MIFCHILEYFLYAMITHFIQHFINL